MKPNDWITDDDYSVVSVQDKTDSKSVSITYSSPTITYTIEKSDEYWTGGGGEDSFLVQYKNDFTGESTFITVHVTCYLYDANFDASNIDLDIYPPYPESLRVNLVPGMGTITDFVFYKSGPFDPSKIEGVSTSKFGTQEVWVDLPRLGELNDVTTSFAYYVGNITEGIVDEATDTTSLANINLTFKL
ncbi:MAG: hypothetical protein CL840_16520 [Crocinitomicaceae bacterium]|nr:hypothetical protein [Crocinitomicaceae bacterium]|tara:strand:+ start:14203 stop:14766 length:564 start_codon:yes stop_codon:yes gene_type:complete